MTKKLPILFLLIFILLFSACNEKKEGRITKGEIQKVEREIYSFQQYQSTYEECKESITPYFHEMTLEKTLFKLPLYPHYIGIMGLGTGVKIYLGESVKSFSQEELERFFQEEVEKEAKTYYGDVIQGKSFFVSESYETNGGVYFFTKRNIETDNFFDLHSEKRAKLVLFRRYLVSLDGEEEKILSLDTYLQVENLQEIQAHYEKNKENREKIMKEQEDKFFDHKEVSFSEEIPF